MIVTKWNSLIVVTLIITALAGGAFYWYEWRPSNIKKACNIQAEDKARELMKVKYETAKDYTPQKDVYYQSMNRGLFLKDDYEQYYKNCLRENGI